MAISAVSRSRISPTMMMSGSCRRMDRSAAANVSPILGFTGICVTPATWYSTGSSTVTILTPGWFSRSSAPYSVVVFPEPVGEDDHRSEEHTSELQSQSNLVCRLLLEKKKNKKTQIVHNMQPLGERLK